jgi:CO/xanthine dehydrogenase FAD-binding subunit
MQTAHPGIPEFEYIKPASLAEASEFLAKHAGESRPFMGGTDTFVRMRDGYWKDKYLVDVKSLDGMRVIQFVHDQGLTIGAAVPMNQVIAHAEVTNNYPLLVEAARSVASYQLRSRATIAGNLCNASPAGDTTGACIVFDGVLKVHGVKGYREEPLGSFFKGPGKTALQPGDIVTAIHLPLPPKGAEGKYIKLGRNQMGDLAIVGVTVLGYPDAMTASGFCFRIALASVAPVPLVTGKAEEILASQLINAATIEKAAEAAMDAATPIDDVRGGAHYRKLMVRNLTRIAISDVWARLKK